jgi:hypothetical protein
VNAAIPWAYATTNVETMTQMAEPRMKKRRRYFEEDESDNAPEFDSSQ